MPLKVLHCPTAVAGNPYGLAKSERKVGLISKSISLTPTNANHKVDELLVKKEDGFWKKLLARVKLFIIAKQDFDVVCFNFGQSLTPNMSVNKLSYLGWFLNSPLNFIELCDLALLKKANKKIIFIFQGDDARQGGFCRDNFEITFANEVDSNYYSTYTDEHKKWRINKIKKYADKIFYLNPDLGYVLPPEAEFMPYASVDYREWECFASHNIPETPLILHAPSHQKVKGTKYVLDAVKRLEREGYKFNFELVNLPFEEAKMRYKEADIIIDQLLAGWYGGFAVEAMALGKPVISYIREKDLSFIPLEMKNDLPIINASPQNIYNKLKRYIENPELLNSIGLRSRSYIEKWHDPDKIVLQLISEYEKI